ncbi:hypothetical protein [Micromonospora auratinigra]|uniref:Uncharacterized protein n=1 Tax=Micromonospora auratinigra TaxID=261654 RepID=A0A1A8ZHI9_9ACTN|nr:hypothetical protein [Micromonospora auratinigra]SBT43494.1 hypothetical protein GA0070611_2340 [Micromonospora auratinigra]
MTGTTGGPLVGDTTPRRAIHVRAHRWLVIVGAVLTGVALLLLSLLPDVPAEVGAVTAWVERGHSLLSWSDELLFFAVICWGAGARGLVGAREAGPSVRISVGGTALAVALVALVVVLLAVGRLVYPVFGIHLSAEVVALVVSATFGALHLALLGFAVAAVALGWSTRAGLTGRAVGIIAAAAFVLGSFPWLTPHWWNSAVAVLVAGWATFLALAGD